MCRWTREVIDMSTGKRRISTLRRRASFYFGETTMRGTKKKEIQKRTNTDEIAIRTVFKIRLNNLEVGS